MDPPSPQTPVRKPTIIRVRGNPQVSNSTQSPDSQDLSANSTPEEQVVLRQKPPPPLKPKPQIGEKPVIAKKPTTSAKPKSITETSTHDGKQALEAEKTLDNARPKSLRVMEDKGHSQVAAALTDLLSRPRSSSKGLLHTTQYSQDDNTGHTLEGITPTELNQPHHSPTNGKCFSSS